MLKVNRINVLYMLQWEPSRRVQIKAISSSKQKPKMKL